MSLSDQSYRVLTDQEKRVIEEKGTEAPFTGKYYKFNETGTYHCRKCGAALYHSEDKFESDCGWPSFDNEITGAVTRKTDPDGRRIEISCSKCGAHLGHVFSGEGFTQKNIRHCVNSISLDFVPSKNEVAYFAGGCFWGVEHLLQKEEGVISVKSGFMGGTLENPSYKEVREGNTGHAETVEVLYDANLTSYETLAKLFFEIHDPTHINHQGPDVGMQYRSEIFYTNEEQKTIAQKLISTLEQKGYKIATKLTKSSKFWPAEEYHQDYYEKKGTEPYCHIYTKRF